MSSLPGLSLEDFLAWNYDLVVEGQEDANYSLAIAEMLDRSLQPRPRITPEQFKPIVEMFEPYREFIEYRLSDFDEETQSWRDYACFAFDAIPALVYSQALDIVKSYRGIHPTK